MDQPKPFPMPVMLPDEHGTMRPVVAKTFANDARRMSPWHRACHKLYMVRYRESKGVTNNATPGSRSKYRKGRRQPSPIRDAIARGQERIEERIKAVQRAAGQRNQANQRQAARLGIR